MRLFYRPEARRNAHNGRASKECVVWNGCDVEAVHERLTLVVPPNTEVFLEVKSESVVGFSLCDNKVLGLSVCSGDVFTYDKSDEETIRVGESFEYHVVGFDDGETFTVARIEFLGGSIEIEVNRYALESTESVDGDVCDEVGDVVHRHLASQLVCRPIPTLALPGEEVL